MDLVALAIARKNSGAGETTDFVKKTDIASTAVAGIVKAYHEGGTQMLQNDKLSLLAATNNEIQAGTSYYKPIVAATAKNAVFYGLYGMTTLSQRYTPAEIDSILSKLSILSLLGCSELDTTATVHHNVSDIFFDGKTASIVKATSEINIGDAIVSGTNCTKTSILELLKEAFQS